MQPGDLVDARFEVVRLAGRGGMGEVYQARDRQSGDTVAVKVLRGDALDLRARFEREARVLAELRHPGIVRYVAHGLLPSDEVYLAMEWLEGEDLGQRLRRGVLSVAETLSIVTAAADALDLAHERGIVHRDIKPANIFLERGSVERVRVLDFGVARLLGATRAMTEVGAAIGTPSYMAPEQARGEEGVDARCDVFALGCVLFECLVGKPAFVGEHVLAVLAKVLFHEPPDLRTLRPEAPAALSDLLCAMLSKDRAGRPRDARDLLARLRAVPLASDSPGAAHAPERAAHLGTEELRRLFVVVCGSVSGAGLGGVAEHDAFAPTAATPSEGERSALQRLALDHEVRLERLLDGSVVASFSTTTSAKDAAARAARCALALRRLRPRDAIAVATGRGRVAGALPSGEVIDRAVALARARRGPTDGGSLRIDEGLVGLLDPRFLVRSEAEGFVLESERAPQNAPRTLLGRPTPCVGRDRELALLLGSVEQCIDEGAARAVLVTAPPGVGKSRLRHELLAEVARMAEPPQCWLAHAEALGAGSAFGLLGQLVRGSAGVQDGEPATQAQRKLHARTARHLREPEAMLTAVFLGELAGVEFEEGAHPLLPSARRDARVMSDQMLDAFERFLRAECAAGPVVLVIEDLHWGDLPSVRFIEHALTRLSDSPLCVIAFARPEVHDVFADLWARAGVSEVRLPPIGKRACARLIAHALGEDASTALVERLVKTAAGNAFYLEELIRTVAEGRSELPDSVLAMAQTRYEALDPSARQVLRAGAVFGEAFWAAAVRELLPREVGVQLDAELTRLSGMELLEPRPTARFAGQQEYRFRHALLREAAYAALLDDDLRLGHRLAATWLETAGERDAITLAEHCLRAKEPERAAHFFRVAGEQALEGGDFVAAAERAGRALECGARGEDATAAKLCQIDAFKWLGEHARMVALARSLAAEEPEGSLAWCRAVADLCIARVDVAPWEHALARVEVSDDLLPAFLMCACRVLTQSFIRLRGREVEPLYQRVEAMVRARPSHDPALVGWFDQARAFHAAAHDQDDVAIEAFRASARAFHELGDIRNALAQRIDEAFALNDLGAFPESRAAFEAALADMRDKGIGRLETLARFGLVWPLWRMGDLDQVAALLALVRPVYEATQVHPNLALVPALQAMVCLARGQTEDALRLARESCAMADAQDPRYYDTRGVLAEILNAQGRFAEAWSLLEAPFCGSAVLSATVFGSERYMRAKIEAARGLGRAAEANRIAADLRAYLERRVAAVRDPAFRARSLAYARSLDPGVAAP